MRRSLRVGASVGALALAPQARRVFVLAPTDRVVQMLDEQGTLLGTSRVGRSDDAGALVVNEHTARVFVANTHDNTVSVLDAHSGRDLLLAGVVRR